MKTRILSALIVCSLCYQANAARITSVSKIGGTAEVPVITELTEGVEAYTDRNHILVNIPSELSSDGSVPTSLQLSNDDKGAGAALQHQVTLGQLSILYIGLDDRLPAQPLDWMNNTSITGLPAGFHDTGAHIDIDESADGSINQTFSLWATLAPAGTYTLEGQTAGFGGNQYIVFADNKLVPEPGSITLVLLGLAGMVARVRRRM